MKINYPRGKTQLKNVLALYGEPVLCPCGETTCYLKERKKFISPNHFKVTVFNKNNSKENNSTLLY